MTGHARPDLPLPTPDEQGWLMRQTLMELLVCQTSGEVPTGEVCVQLAEHLLRPRHSISDNPPAQRG